MSNVRKELTDRVLTRLAASIIDVELDADDLEECVISTLEKYRQRSSNSVEEGYFYLELQEDQTEYFLPKEIVEVREIFRRGLGRTQGGVTFDPFNAAFTNFYILEAGKQGGLATYRLFTEYQELIGTMFGEHMMFNWQPNKHRLQIQRHIRGPESVLLWCSYYRTDDEIIEDIYARPWIVEYSTAHAKIILGEGRGKYSQIIGPQGGTTLNGAELKNEGFNDKERLEQELLEYGDGGTPLSFIIG